MFFGKRDYDACGSDLTLFGYIKESKFIFTDKEYELDLVGGQIIDFKCFQTGGYCMVDYIKMEDGGIYLIADEVVIRYKNQDTFTREFEEQTLDCFDAEQKGLLEVIEEPITCKKRSNEDLVKQDKIYQDWALEQRGANENE